MKAWLNANKIYFETVAATALTVMALVLTCRANTIASNQTKLLRTQNQPIFVVSTDSGLFRVENRGSPAKHADLQIATFLRAHARLADPRRGSWIEAREATCDYVEYWTHFENVTGVMFHLGPLDNFREPPDLALRFKEFGNDIAPHFTDSDIRFEPLLRISFLDVFEQSQTQYLSVGYGLGNPRLESDIGQALFRAYNEPKAKCVTLRSVDDESLRNLWSRMLASRR